MVGNATMVRKSPMERLAGANPSSELWWDCSPLLFESWKRRALRDCSPQACDRVADWHERYYLSSDPLRQVFRGATTNPILSWDVVKDDVWFWREWAVEQKRRDPKLRHRDSARRMNLEILRRGAEKYLGLHRRSEGRWGYVTGQVDPRDYEDAAAMRSQAREIAAVASNIMVQIPATAQGIKVVKHLSTQGIATNATHCFTVAQVLAAAEAVRDGLIQARREKINLSHCKSVITMMSSSYEDMGDFEKEGVTLGIKLGDAELRWASIAIVTKAIRCLAEGEFSSILGVASLRPVPDIDGRMLFWPLQKISGANIVFTCPGSLVAGMDEFGEELEFDADAWKEPVPEAVLEKLSLFRYFKKACDPRGLAPEKFNTHPAMIASIRECCAAVNEGERFVAEAIAMCRGKKNGRRRS